MRSLVVGTAGHIDHGKSALVRALTGIDPDRLKEEKERGITIDLGFAHADLGDGLVASFIDVPGHERFVRNMLAGAHGIDAVVLVVAADESVMPQTREHFHICRLLGVARGIVALTKCDVAEEEMRAVAEAEVRELVAGSFLERAPMIPVSARTGAGLDAVRDGLRALGRTAAPRRQDGIVRVPVDRAFTMRGFGTVVTGTMVSGTLAVGEEVEILPLGRRARIRGLQVHGQATERVPAGSRAALNLSGVEPREVERGQVLSRPGQLRATSLLDAELSLLATDAPLADGTRVRLHVASAEVLARVRVLGSDTVAPGETGVVQFRLERPVVAGRGDRLIVRSYSPTATIGGARVLDPLPPKRRRAERAVLELLSAPGEDAGEVAALWLAAAGGVGIDTPTLAVRLSLPQDQVAGLLASREDVLGLGLPPAVFLSREALMRLGRAAVECLRRFHREHPLRPSMPREELRRRAFARAPEAAFARVLADLDAAGALRLLAESVALAGHSVTLSSGEAEARQALLQEAEAAGLAGLEVPAVATRSGRDPRVLDRVAQVLVDEGALLRVGTGFLVHRAHLESLKEEVRRRWPPGSRLDVGGFKDLTGLTRKFVIPLLEFLDRERVTRRSGTDRLVLA